MLYQKTLDQTTQYTELTVHFCVQVKNGGGGLDLSSLSAEEVERRKRRALIMDR